MKKLKRWSAGILAALAALYLLLLIPYSKNHHAGTFASGTPFLWGQDTLWENLESDFKQARLMGTADLDSSITRLKQREQSLFSLISNQKISPGDSMLLQLQHHFFKLAPLVAAKPAELGWYIKEYNLLRKYIKAQSVYWHAGKVKSRQNIYGLFYGLRAATEEVVLQCGAVASNANMVTNERSATPAAQILGIPVHSGDVLVSRGGAEVSALISRGNDYPGNFSHVALLYIDAKTGQPWLVEAHIEKGVAVATLEEYLEDKKLRIMALRPRSDLPGLTADPMLPHKAASLAFEAARQRHIPYDFKMNFHDSSAMFCSEVASFAYGRQGLRMWEPISTISSPGIVNWLQAFGVENFVTQMPSDLEYDPQFAVVAEWYDPETLFKDHIDNAVMDAMLSRADAGEEIGYNHWQLPLVRLVKGYCMIKNLFGGIGIIPEGMSATQALKNQRLVAMHQRINQGTIAKANTFVQQNHYRPPYWQLVKFAEQAF